MSDSAISEKGIRILKYMLEKGDMVTSRELEINLGLRQPEVSVILKDFFNRGWIDYEKIKRAGRGRPLHKYFLKVSKEEIVNQLKKEYENEIKRLHKKMGEIEKMFM